jgi:hypothetical protein
VTVTPTVNQANATVKVNTVTVTSGQASGTISLNVGTNTITTVVTAQDGTTTDTYTITVTRAVALSSDKAITAFNFAGLSPAVTGTINGTTIALTVPFGTAVTALVPTVTITGSSVSPASGVAGNFTTPVTYTVTAADSTTQDYTVTITIATDTTCSTVANATTYNAYPTCGVATCNSGYTLSNGACVASGGGGGMPAGWSNLPITPTSGFKVTINSGASTTVNRIVNLNFNAGTDIKKMAISMLGDFSDAVQENYSPIKQFDICSKAGGFIKNPTCPDGQYTIYVKFYTSYGVASNIVSTKINLTTNPTKNISSTSQNLTSAIFTKPLSFGMSSSDVRRLQTLLATKPEIYPEGLITGYFGQLTKKAVQRFQLNYKVVSSKYDPGFGYVGPKTRTKLQEVFGK